MPWTWHFATCIENHRLHNISYTEHRISEVQNSVYFQMTETDLSKDQMLNDRSTYIALHLSPYEPLWCWIFENVIVFKNIQMKQIYIQI